MDFRRLSLTYVVTYLTIGGAGFLIAPELARDLLLSNRDYENVGFRIAGTMMLALAYLIWTIVGHQDWKYYPRFDLRPGLHCDRPHRAVFQ